MKEGATFYFLVALALTACTSGKEGNAGTNSEAPREVYEAAKAQILDVGFKNCGEFWGSVYKKENPLDFTNPAEYQFKNLQMQIQTNRIPLSQADKMNGIQWNGILSFSADATRERPVGGKEWSRWVDGFTAAFNLIGIEDANGKISMNGGTALRAACPQ